jgi:Tn3 transposase DDE domain
MTTAVMPAFIAPERVQRAQGYPVRDEDAARLSPLGYAHINMLGRYSFPRPTGTPRLKALRDPDHAEA